MMAPDWFYTFEFFLKLSGGIAGIGTLGYAIFNILKSQKRPTGRTTGAARRVLRTPYLVGATIVFCFLSYLLWKPLPIQVTWIPAIILILAGSLIYFPSLALYIWGLLSLGENFNASSGFGVRLVKSHQLVTNGPYAYIRHPMYLAVILACWGGLLIYLTWTMLLFAVIMLGLFMRARREEQALAQEFGDTWVEYRTRVPGWLPRLPARRR